MFHEEQVLTNEKPLHNEVTISISCELIMEQLGIDPARWENYLLSIDN